MKRGRNNFFWTKKTFFIGIFLSGSGGTPSPPHLCRKNPLSSIWQLPLTSCHLQRAVYTWSTFQLSCLSDPFYFQSLKLRLRIILARCLHYICEYVKMAYTRCLLRKCVGPIFSLLPVSNHVQVRRVAGGQIIPVRAGFVQDTQLPLFSPNSLCCSCLFCWSNHWWAAELGRFYQSLSEYWVPPPPPLPPPSSAKWMLSTAVHYHLPTTTGYNCPNCPQKVQLCVQDPGVSLPTTCIWTKTGQKGF